VIGEDALHWNASGLKPTYLVRLHSDIHVHEHLFARQGVDDLKSGIWIDLHRAEISATEYHDKPVRILSDKGCRKSRIDILDVVEPYFGVSKLVDVLFENLLDLSTGGFDDGEAILIIDSLSAHSRRTLPTEPAEVSLRKELLYFKQRPADNEYTLPKYYSRGTSPDLYLRKKVYEKV
jgi:hypothetical protein